MTRLVALAITGALAFAAPQSADDRELQQYRLTNEILTKVEAVAKAFEANVAKDPKMKRHLDAKRELAVLEDKDNLTPAEQKRAEELGKILGDGESLEFSIEGGSLSEMSAQFMKIPPMAAALKSAGMPAREMAKFIVTAVQAAVADAMGGAVPPGLNGENVKFVKANQGAIERINKLLGAK
jgi:hypothetical protein